MPRVVFDSGVLVSAAIKPRGVCGQLLYQAVDSRWEIVVCPMLLAELSGVLRRPKFRRYLTEDEAGEFFELLSGIARHESDPRSIPSTTLDRDDDYLIALATESQADWLVSGDAHLSNLAEVDVIVVPPGQMLEIILERFA